MFPPTKSFLSLFLPAALLKLEPFLTVKKENKSCLIKDGHSRLLGILVGSWEEG